MNTNVWRSFINKPRLKNHISATAEVGYSHYGPTFAIAGIITALNTVVLIHNICVEITDKSKKNSHFMDWFAFRPTQYVMGNFSEIDLTMTSKFTITPEQAYGYNILFIDNGRFSEMKPLFKAIKDAWEEALLIAAKEQKSVNPETLYTEFKKLKIISDATERLKTMGYWNPGDYLAKIRITTENPKQFFDTEKSFTLNKSDEQTLTNNASIIIANICQQPQMLYASVTPSLTNNKKTAP